MRKNKQRFKNLVVTPIGGGRFYASWGDGKWLYEAVFTDRWAIEDYKKMKNPYKHGIYPCVVIPYEAE